MYLTESIFSVLKMLLSYIVFYPRYFYIFYFLVLGGDLMNAQKPVLQVKHLDIRDGLSDNRISDVVQDSSGVIWAATKLGVNRYDGDNVKIYPINNVSVLYDLKLIGAEKILIGTDKGLYAYNKKNDQFEKIFFKNQNNEVAALDSEVFCISNSNSNNFWFAGKGGRFHYIQDNELVYSFRAQEINKNIRNANIVTVLAEKKGKIWLGTNDGQVWYFNFEKRSLRPVIKLKNFKAINDILKDSLNQLWIATNGNGVYKYRISSEELVHYMDKNAESGNSINNNVVLSLFQGKDNRIFIGTDGGGINLYQPKKDKFTYFKQEDGEWGLSDNSILCFGRGMHNVIWAGTVHGGISYFKDRIDVFNVSPKKLAFGNDKQSSKILEDSKGNLWITAGRDGLRKYNPTSKEIKIFKDDKNSMVDLSGDIILSLKEDDKGRIWIGSLRGGLNIYDLNLRQFLTFPERENLKAIYSIEKGPDNKMWVGTDNGIVVFNDRLRILRRFNTFTCPDLSSNIITSIYKDVKQEMWVGTENGLNIFSPEGEHLQSFFSSSKDSTSLSSNHILSIVEGADLSLYIGTYGFGLNRYSRRNENFKRIGEKEGLDGNVIRGILLDKQKSVWLSTNRGLSRIKNDTISNFGIHEGIPPFHGGKASLSKTGNIFFAGDHGLSYFNPENFKKKTSSPKLFIRNFKIVDNKGSRNINPSNFVGTECSPLLQLSPDYSLFAVNFSSSNYFDSDSYLYYYKLNGLDNEWHNLNKEKSIVFSNLAPGDYNLLLGTKKDSKNVSQEVTSLRFKVLPSFWERPEIQIFGISFLGLGIFLAANIRNRNIRKQRDKLKKIVAFQTAQVEEEKERAYKNKLEILKIEKLNEQLKQKRLSDELNFKTEELTNSTLRTVHKNNLLVAIKEDFITEGKKNIEYKKFFEKIVEKIDDSLAIDTEWTEFYSIFDQVHPSFISCLKERTPSLTERELKLCALIKLKFPSHQIATLFGISLSSIKVARHRLRKKLKIKEGLSFHDYFSNLGI